MKTSKTEAIILFSQPLFEKDRLIEVMTPTQGKLKLLAKSGQKRFAGYLETGNWVSLTIYKSGSMPLITECAIEKAFPHIRSHFNRLSLMFYAISMTRFATAFHQPNPDLFQFLTATLTQLNDPNTPMIGSKNSEHTQKWIESQFLSYEGISQDHHNFHTQFYDYSGKSLAGPLLIE